MSLASSMDEADKHSLQSVPPSPSRPSSVVGEPTASADHRARVVIDHQGQGKVISKPDGTVVWEPAGDRAVAKAQNNHSPREHMVMYAMVLPLVGAMVGVGATVSEMAHARNLGMCLTNRQLTTVVANTVGSCLAGTIVGCVMGPLQAAHALTGVLIRPAILALGVHGGVAWLRRHRTGVVALIKKLQSGDLAKQLEALRSIISQAMKSADFSREFNKFAGIELLLKQLSDVFPDSPLLHLLVMALGELIKDNDCKESLVAAGGVPRLVSLLSHPNATVCERALTVLVRLADHPLAQDAIREAGGLPRLVEMAATPLGPAAAAAHMLHSSAAGGGSAVPASPAAVAAAGCMPLSAVSLLASLALDPANKAAIGAVNGVQCLLEVVRTAPARSQLQLEAVVALHNVLRGSPENQRMLAAIPSAGEVLRGVLSMCGPSWYPAKSDLHALLNVLARLHGTQEASGFIVVAPASAAVHAPASASQA